MKTTLALFVGLAFALLSFSPIMAQKYCGFDALMETLYSTDQEEQSIYNMNHRILDRQLSLTNAERMTEYVIPVVVHIIHQNGEENISDAQVEQAIEHLNMAFGNEPGTFNNPEGVDVPIRFCLAGTDPDGEFTTGIVRVEDPLTVMHTPSEDLALKDLSRWDPTLYYNMWIVSNIIRDEDNSGVVGYATFPSAHGSDLDGIVCEASLFGIDDTPYSKVHIHETGHYLGLYHTFQDLCPNDDCLTSGDWVCDTPPDQVTFNSLCYDGTNSCSTDEDDLSENNPFRPVDQGGIGDQVDEQDNYMDYSNLFCFNQFTQGQSDRMLASLLEIRSSLLEGDRCSTPCATPFDASIVAGDLFLEVGDNSAFVLQGDGYDGVNWYLDDVVVSTDGSYVFNASAEGTFELVAEVYNDDPGCTQEFEFVLEVICGVSATFSGQGGTWPLGSTLEYVNDDPNATSWSWTVNGNEESDTPSLTYTFDNAGVYTVQLTVSNGLCTDTQVLNIAVGSCTTGREANVWYFHNESGNFFGLNFNPGEDFLIEENPNIPSPVSHNKSTFCDGSGELLYFTNGDAIYHANGDLLTNGDDLLTHPSAHWGSIFIRKPGSDHEVYLFTGDANENNFANGIRYHLIDQTLDGGNGAVVPGEKNVLVEVTTVENATTVRHCNLVDFWLVILDPAEGVIKSFLVTEDGVSDEPVVSEVQITSETASYSFPLKANGPGDLLLRGEYLYEFDPATGEAATLHVFNVDFVFSYCFSYGGTKIYWQAGEIDVDLFQADITGPISGWDETITPVFNADVTDLGFGFSIGPDGNLYQEESFSGWLSYIPNSDAPANEVEYVNNNWFIEGTVNGFANFHHGYIYGPQLFIQGPAVACEGDELNFEVFRPDCVTAPITWSLTGDGVLTETGPGEVSVEIGAPGELFLVAEAELFCGAIIDTLVITVGEFIDLDLGPDLSLCNDGTSIILDAGSGYTSYLWQDGSNDQTYEVNVPGTYSVTVFNGVCEATDEVEIGSGTPTLDLGPDFEVCEEAIVINAGNGYSDFVWQDGWTGPNYTVYEAGTYWVTANTPCFASDTVIVTDCGIIINNIDEENSSEDQVWIDLQSDVLHITSGAPIDRVRVFDNQGRLVIEKSTITARVTQVNLSNSADGIYAVVLGDGEDLRSYKVLKE